jgi:glucose/mannose-6-phosphate isomerase
VINLDDITKLEEFDTGKMFTSIRNIPDQMEQAWTEVDRLEIPKSYSAIENIVFCGMGGSALGGRIIDSLTTSTIRVPFEIFTEYNLPNYVNNKTLVILSSYSGNTEETINCAHEALNKNALVVGITTGGKLSEFLERNKLPRYLYEPKSNISNQPRMALGYSVASVLKLLSKIGIYDLDNQEFFEICTHARQRINAYDTLVKTDENVAKMLSTGFFHKSVILISSEFLYGVTHAVKNQINENSKTFSALFDIPEINHHLMEGLKFPEKLREITKFLFITSDLYKLRILKIHQITKSVIEKNGFDVLTFKPEGKTKSNQIIDTLIFGSFFAVYLAFLYGIDPIPIPWVDYFKQELSK